MREPRALSALMLCLALSSSASAQDAASDGTTTDQAVEAPPDPAPAPPVRAEPPAEPPPTARTTTTTTSTTRAIPPSHTATPTMPPPTTTADPVPEPEGDGRDVDFLWVEVEGGVSNVNLIAFRNVNFAAGETDVLTEVTGTGPMVGAAVGFRVWWLAVGARFTFASYDVFQIGTVGGDVQLRLPIPVIEPYLRVGFGYAWQGEASYRLGAVTTSTNVFGWSFDAALGFDIFLTNWLTLGAGVGLDVLNMTRQRDPVAMPITTFNPSMDGDAIGYQLRGFAQLGLHF